mgnify:CR=1 FL=1
MLNNLSGNPPCNHKEGKLNNYLHFHLSNFAFFVNALKRNELKAVALVNSFLIIVSPVMFLKLQCFPYHLLSLRFTTEKKRNKKNIF